jgi:hypothetical protein
MVPPLRWFAISQRTIAPLRLPALKSRALPLAWREILPVPLIRAPGRQVEMS